MLDSMRAIGAYTITGAVSGAVMGAGAGVGLTQVPLVCGLGAIGVRFFAEVVNGKSMDTVFNEFFQSCQTGLPIVGATGGGLCGAGVGFICGVIKEICNNNRINLQRVNQN